MKEARNHRLDHKIKAKSEDLIWHLHEYSVDLPSNHIYLLGSEAYTYGVGAEGTYEPGVEFTMANRFIKNLNLCMRVNPETPLVIHLKTCGGDWTEGMAIYDAIRSFPWPVTILNYTHARSMSSLIFQAGNKKVMMPNSYFMFHDGTNALSGTVKQVRSSVKFEEKVIDPTMMEIYVKSMKERGSMTSKTPDQIQKWLRARMDKEEDVYLSAQEAVDLGLADEVFDYDWSSLTKYTEEQLKR